MAERFLTNWVFDVETIGRMIENRRGTGQPGPAEVIRAIPLWEWRDVDGSQVKPLDFFRCLATLLQIYRRYLRG